MSKILTISVAAYNIEKYIHKMMHSLIDAGCLEDLEILIVDDGSKDNTAKLAREYEATYPNSVRHVEKENGGHGSTINKGIELATGKYFRALDGDDWVNSENLKELVSSLRTTDVDMVVCDFDRCYSDGLVVTEKINDLKPDKKYSFDEITRYTSWICYHSIVYKTQLLKDQHIRLDEHCFYVDEEYDLYPIPYVQTVLYFDKSVYCYRLGVNEQSVSPQSRKKNIKHGFTVAESLLKFFAKESADLSESKNKYIGHGIADHCVWQIESLMLFPCSIERMKEIKTFDKSIQAKSNVIYMEMGQLGKQSRKINLLRRSSYLMYFILCIYKRMRTNK